ncbi:hypothetical protein SLEP1_g5683 [Rubroshorea leprosula]|uniref:Uncharacterized protein n=1 Tax=Rubroshorea leprosula TaxID=152421 RepID=A0AAV5I3B9_9ROSI|nr:hypothetical protein SLEP1_g5683 [Rubroshorea leprosula]
MQSQQQQQSSPWPFSRTQIGFCIWVLLENPIWDLLNRSRRKEEKEEEGRRGKEEQKERRKRGKKEEG